MQQTYEAPQLTVVGSVKDLTLGDGVWGNDDTLVFNVPIFGWSITLHYGTAS